MCVICYQGKTGLSAQCPLMSQKVIASLWSWDSQIWSALLQQMFTVVISSDSGPAVGLELDSYPSPRLNGYSGLARLEVRIWRICCGFISCCLRTCQILPFQGRVGCCSIFEIKAWVLVSINLQFKISPTIREAELYVAILMYNVRDGISNSERFWWQPTILMDSLF